jgi:hypothetical protein
MPAALFYTGPSLRALHEDYAKNSRIDAAAPLTVTSSIIIDAPPDQVWAVLSDVAAWPAWHPAMTVFSLDAVRPDATLRWKLGRVPIQSTFAVVSPPRELTWTGRFLGYKAVDQHLLGPAPDGRTTATMRESLAGPLLPLLFSRAKLEAAHQRWLADLKTRVENGAISS